MRVIVPVLAAVLFGCANATADVEESRAAAVAAQQAGDLQKAAVLYRNLLKEAPEDGAGHYQLGIVLMSGGDSEAAISHFEKAREYQFQPLGVGYRLARIHALGGREEAALEQLEGIAAAGFPMPQLIEGEADFTSIAGHPRYAAALAAIRGNRYPCKNVAGAHAFDFWIGEWDVFQAGAPAGSNRIEPILGECALLENWTSATGSEGKSFNFYDPGYDRWRQVWISDTGSFIDFFGEARDGGIYYKAETRNPQNGQVMHHKLEFTQNEDGSVRQLWQQSSDGGETWNTVWDGHYVRKAERTADSL